MTAASGPIQQRMIPVIRSTFPREGHPFALIIRSSRYRAFAGLTDFLAETLATREDPQQDVSFSLEKMIPSFMEYVASLLLQGFLLTSQDDRNGAAVLNNTLFGGLSTVPSSMDSLSALWVCGFTRLQEARIMSEDPIVAVSSMEQATALEMILLQNPMFPQEESSASISLHYVLGTISLQMRGIFRFVQRGGVPPLALLAGAFERLCKLFGVEFARKEDETFLQQCIELYAATVEEAARPDTQN